MARMIFGRTQKTAGIFLLVLIFIFCAFQNCSLNPSLSQDAPPNPTHHQLAAESGGEGYAGMHYIARGRCGGTDGAVMSEIVVSTDQTSAVLVYHDCHDLNPAVPLATGSWTLMGSQPATLVYEGTTYVLEVPSAETPTPSASPTVTPTVTPTATPVGSPTATPSPTPTATTGPSTGPV